MDREINRPGKSLYFYCLDRDFGPFFLKFCSYCPALLLFQLLPAGFSNRNLRDNLAPLLGQQPADLTQGRMTYHLRRLRLHAMIERIPKSHRYRVTALACAPLGSLNAPTPASSGPAWAEYCPSFPTPPATSASASINSIRR